MIAASHDISAASTELVNGVLGDAVPGPGPGSIAGPAGTVGSGGGLAHDHDHTVPPSDS